MRVITPWLRSVLDDFSVYLVLALQKNDRVSASNDDETRSEVEHR